MAKKMKTMDGNTAAAHAAYAFTEVAEFTPSLRRHRWPSQPMSGRPAGRRIFSGSLSRLLRCSPKPVLPAQFMDHFKLAH